MHSSMSLRADARCVPMRTGAVQCVVTSPPYFGLRCYGDDEREIGRADLAEYIEGIRQAAGEVWRILDERGLFWLNLGDTASGSGGAGGDYNEGGSKAGKPKYRQGDTGAIPPMSWCSVPHRVVHALVDDGWLLRADICWDKGVIRAEDVNHVRRPRLEKEPIFMLAKSRNHRYYPEGEVEPGNVWRFPPARGKKKNSLAPFPDELARRCILVSTHPDDVVADVFNGSGTTTRVAAELGRRGIGTDLYEGKQ